MELLGNTRNALKAAQSKFAAALFLTPKRISPLLTKFKPTSVDATPGPRDELKAAHGALSKAETPLREPASPQHTAAPLSKS